MSYQGKVQSQGPHQVDLTRKLEKKNLHKVLGGEREYISGQTKFELGETCQLTVFLIRNFNEFESYPEVCGNLLKNIKHENNTVNIGLWIDHCGW